MEKVTTEIFSEYCACGEPVWKNIEYAQSFRSQYPYKPVRPVLSQNHTAQEATEYANKMSIYESLMSEYKNTLNQCTEENNRINSIIESYIKEESGLNSLPEKTKRKLWDKAWSDGHSNGYSEVYNCLCSLVELFD